MFGGGEGERERMHMPQMGMKYLIYCDGLIKDRWWSESEWTPGTE